MKITKTLVHGWERFRVSWESGGTTKRKFFPTEKEAKDFGASLRSDIENLGNEWASFPISIRAEMVSAWNRAKEGGYSVLEACRFYESRKATTSNTTLEDLIKVFMQSKVDEGKRPETIRLLQTTMNQFQTGREKMKAALITTEQIADWLRSQGWGPWRRRGALIDLKNLFNWGVRMRHIPANPADPINPPNTETDEISILTVEQAKTALKLAQAPQYESLRGWLYLGLFGGIRQAELERLSWEFVNGNYVTIPRKIAKGKSRRLVTIRPVLAEWLKLLPQGRTGLICGNTNEHRKRAVDFRAALGGWKKNVMRHSFISYELGATQNITATAAEAGNSPDVIDESYRELVTKEQATAFWNLTPEACRG